VLGPAGVALGAGGPLGLLVIAVVTGVISGVTEALGVFLHRYHPASLRVYGSKFIPPTLTYSQSLHAFKLFYVNKYANHHSHEIAF
jgi:amino acid permease